MTASCQTRIVKLLVVAGARPNFMKVAPLLRACQARNATRGEHEPLMQCRLVHTGQHYDKQMSDVFFRELGIAPPDINLEVGSGSHAVQTATIMTRFEPVLASEQPDWVVVVGDVNSTMASTLVAAKMGVKVAHVEAGLRSFDRTMPEEINRLVTDALADLLFTPSADANENLAREGVPTHKIRLVGNIMIDALVANLDRMRECAILDELGLAPGQFTYVTLHRPSNVDARENLARILEELRRLAGTMPVVFPMHPRTRKRCEEFGLSPDGIPGLKLLSPLGYHASLRLTAEARLVLTDSGGLQEEATWFRTPCLTLRPNTERPITLTQGSNRLTSLHRLRADIADALAGQERVGQIPPLWDGNTAGRIVDALVDASGS